MTNRRTLLRAALLPAFPEVDASECAAALAAHGDELRRLILSQGLGPLWHARAGVESFRQTHRDAAAAYLAQRAAIAELVRLFAGADIPHAIFKGAATRELVYEQPATRQAADIDVLVAPAHRTEAAQALVEAGYRLHVLPANASHQATLVNGPVHIDLHWGMVRPGRMRGDVTASLLESRRRAGSMWVLEDTDALFLMLVHPAFTEHVSAGETGAFRAADILRWLHQRPVDWTAIHERLGAGGVRTAAWAVLRWVRSISPGRHHDAVDPAIEVLRPGRARRAYLEQWIDRDLPYRTARLHGARLLGFSLLLHDRPSDAIRAVGTLRETRRNRAEDAAVFVNGLAGQRQRPLP